MNKNFLSRLLASIIFFFYGGGVIVVWVVDAMRDFYSFKLQPFGFIGFTIWGLLATAFGVFLWNDKGKSL